MNIFKKPIITERSIKQTKKGFYTFGVEKTARKEEIKKAVENQFQVNVVSIKTIKMSEKTRRSGKSMRKSVTPQWKKAIIKIKDGQKIALFEIGT